MWRLGCQLTARRQRTAADRPRPARTAAGGRLAVDAVHVVRRRHVRLSARVSLHARRWRGWATRRTMSMRSSSEPVARNCPSWLKLSPRIGALHPRQTRAGCLARSPARTRSGGWTARGTAPARPAASRSRRRRPSQYTCPTDNDGRHEAGGSGAAHRARRTGRAGRRRARTRCWCGPARHAAAPTTGSAAPAPTAPPPISNTCDTERATAAHTSTTPVPSVENSRSPRALKANSLISYSCSKRMAIRDVATSIKNRQSVCPARQRQGSVSPCILTRSQTPDLIADCQGFSIWTPCNIDICTGGLNCFAACASRC
jgi:hypothetical protein